MNKKNFRWTLKYCPTARDLKILSATLVAVEELTAEVKKAQAIHHGVGEIRQDEGGLIGAL